MADLVITMPLKLRPLFTLFAAVVLRAQSTVTIENVEGLNDALELRPMKGPMFAPARAAIINKSGRIESAVGALDDCVLVDGSATMCGSQIGENPMGSVDGNNRVFTTTGFPAPATLQVFRNGMLMSMPVDYSLSGKLITFVAAQVPGPGDILRAFYAAQRIVDSSSAINGSVLSVGERAVDDLVFAQVKRLVIPENPYAPQLGSEIDQVPRSIEIPPPPAKHTVGNPDVREPVSWRLLMDAGRTSGHGDDFPKNKPLAFGVRGDPTEGNGDKNRPTIDSEDELRSLKVLRQRTYREDKR